MDKYLKLKFGAFFVTFTTTLLTVMAIAAVHTSG